MAKKAKASPKVWDARWMPVASMQDKVRPCVIVAVSGDMLTVLPMSSEPLRTREQSDTWFINRMAYAAVNREFEIAASEWGGDRVSPECVDATVRSYIKSERRTGV